MRPIALRKIFLVLLAGLAGPGCAKEDLLKHKVDVHEVFPDTRVVELAKAVADGDRDRISRLATPSTVEVTGDEGITLLQWAVLNGSLPGLTSLLEAGADPAHQGMDGYTVMHTAAMAEDSRYLTALLGRRISPDLRNRDGQTPLFIAIAARRTAQIEALLAAGADLNIADNVGDTPLHKAALVNDFERTRALLESGANPRATNAQAATFQDYLFMADPELLNEPARRNRISVREWLTRHGIPVNDPHQ
ncbi:ankyrin repeat domain-containing protein [Lysobacter sp. Root494]|uniref:ankyrin repeat domain-containing protein n=1 Tax=Lysobacter sp. Root494 TaxID=1736549 RepID=UPI00070034F7|nr:ankyrin repeat domain-containing protein [Lysobacter sp. Root494]KQY51120.1 hypothetical protein ASD14_09880 [Lysobacter sp. Root494]